MLFEFSIASVATSVVLVMEQLSIQTPTFELMSLSPNGKTMGMKKPQHWDFLSIILQHFFLAITDLVLPLSGTWLVPAVGVTSHGWKRKESTSYGIARTNSDLNLNPPPTHLCLKSHVTTLEFPVKFSQKPSPKPFIKPFRGGCFYPQT